MNSKQIDRELKSVRVYRGTYARNELSRLKLRKPFALVVNTDSSREPGEHWAAIYAPVRGRCEYFCPLGWIPNKQILNFLIKTSGYWVYCYDQNQFFPSSKCGRYCIAFIKARNSGMSYQRFINHFTWDHESNDKKV